MPASEFVDQIQRVKAGVISDGPGDDFKSLSVHVHDQLFFSWHFNCMFFESLGQFHLGGTTTSYDLVGLEAATHDHDGIIERSFGFFDELLSSSSQDNCGRFGLYKCMKYARTFFE